MNFPTDVMYSKSHEWVKFNEDGSTLIGLTDYAQHALGDIVFVNLPEIGDLVTTGESLGDVESVKAVSDIFSPISGEISEVNEGILDAPEQINSDPYGTWLIKVCEITEQEDLMNAADYEKLCAEED